MPNVHFIIQDLEILISTVNKSSLDFLKRMFPNNSYLEYQILIINQSISNVLLKSTHPNVRVINSSEIGLSKSRNLALLNSRAKWCLIADDDVVYVKDFNQIISKAFQQNAEADILTFMMQNEDGNLFRNYPNLNIHNKKSVSSVNSVVIAFKRESIVGTLEFNTNFGLGATFPTACEYIFLRDALAANCKLVFVSKVILSHPNNSSGQNAASDILLFSRAALFYKYSGFLAYFRLIKQLILLLQQKRLNPLQFFKKFNKGLNGIKTYKKLIKLGLEK